MRWPRVSLAGLMGVVTIVAFDCAILHGPPVLSPVCGLDMALMPIGTALGLAFGDLALRPGGSRRFSLGFAAFGSAAMLAYVACCLTVPEWMAVPDLYYVNEIEPRFMDASDAGLYVVSLLIRGLILAAPQLLLATAGGLLVRRYAA